MKLMRCIVGRAREFRGGLTGVVRAATVSFCIAGPEIVWAQTAGDQGEKNQQNYKLEEVVVTATKRSEDIQDVPVAITALTGADLQQQGMVKFDDYMTVVPGLNQIDAGSSGQGQVVLRGINTGILINNAATVSFVVDDVPSTSSQALGASSSVFPDPDLTNIDRIEVLKGPQGTLYGANSLGGLIKIVSKRPDLNAFSGDGSTDFTSADGGGTGYGVHGSLNIPIVTDELALRVAAFTRSDAGYVKNVELGMSDVNKTDVSGARVDLRLQPTAGLNIDLLSLIQDTSSPGISAVDYDTATGLPVECRYCYAAATGPVFETNYHNVALVVNWSVPEGTLTNALSYVEYNSPGNIDLTSSFGVLNSIFGLPVPADTKTISTAIPAVKKTTEELRFATTRFGNFEGLAGLYYTHEHNDADSFLINEVPPGPTPLPPPLANLSTTHTTALYDEYALFGDITYYITPAVDLTAGGRFTHNKQQATQVSSGILNTGSDAAVTLPPFNSSESPTTYLATLRYRPTEQLNTYARVSTGYRPGGPEVVQPGAGAPTSFQHDTTTNYELGTKGRWLDGRASAELAVYYIDWNNIQVNSFYNGMQVTSNGGKATSKGVELELAFVPARGLTTHFTGAYNRATISNDIVAVNPALGVDTIGARAGDPLPYAPRLTGSASADYVFPISATVQGTLGFTGAYQGSQHTNWSHNLLSPDIVLPSYGTLALRAGVVWSKYSLTLRAMNVTDGYHYTTLFTDNLFPGQGVPSLNSVIAPRVLEVEFDAKF